MLFVYPPTIDWGWMKQRPQQIMSGLAARGHTVYFCNKTRREAAVETLAPGLHLVHDHDAWLQGQWPAIRDRSAEPSVVWVTLPGLAPTIHRYGASLTVYDCVDEFPEWLRDEHPLAEMADVIFCTAERIRQRLRRRYPGRRTELVRNAYDTAMGLHSRPSAPLAKPPDLPNHPGPWIGYIGAWAPWVDEALLRRLARSLPEADILIVGPEFGRKYARDPKLHFLGLKPHAELPLYMDWCSLFLIPFRPNGVTLATNPVKAYEYLATGKPVIATDLPECRRMAPFVDCAGNHGEFLRLTASRLQDAGDRAARTAYALQHTWAHRASEVEEVLAGIAARR
ncbi:group 1 glycosyl transferase [Paenibacillus mucilaginosus 3016]|uniref:Group 1 glycosyl transferase n=2 Tax=Paenibacillus mucilaginosus TaxID=61624 RepID=H6NM18_9BACL|nr:glycosyltransferase [Paenibacillus mucilaginosus]AFC32436.1 group 1 glycosyl transferase [Paenibacillus mucilaginosus 3016]AFH64748.1 glycosyl transferase family 1 [Paenibacillus mucilaginosus K02]WFA22741.1 glycosyltransferase [Paenibacillus mucilaginosus]